MEFGHVSVLLEEVLEGLAVEPGGTYIDCTTGAGGHSEAILEKSSPDGRLLGLDADSSALTIAARRLSRFGKRVTLVNANFAEVGEVARENGFLGADGILFDLGFSSIQIEDAARGFSFLRDGPLDMRLDTRAKTTAADLVNGLPETQLVRILWEYGDELASRRIARRIVERRAERPFERTMDLAQVIESAAGGRKGAKIHPATRSFQALRIAVNDELIRLSTALDQALGVLAPGGRLAVISFHSLEDRIVKRFIENESRTCICPPEAPVCTCSHQPRLRKISKKAIKPPESETRKNPRARSAKLRIAERIQQWQQESSG